MLIWNTDDTKHEWLGLFLRFSLHQIHPWSYVFLTFLFSLFQGVRPDRYSRAIGYAGALIISSEWPAGSKPQHVALCATFVLSHLPLTVLSLGSLTQNQRHHCPAPDSGLIFCWNMNPTIITMSLPTHSDIGVWAVIHFCLFSNTMCVPSISPESIFHSLCSSNKSRWSLSATQRARAYRGLLRMTRNWFLMSYNYSIISWRKCHYTFFSL